MKLNPPASFSDLEVAREIARRLHEQRRTAERRLTTERAVPAPVRRSAVESPSPPSPPAPRHFPSTTPPALDQPALPQPAPVGREPGAAAAPARPVAALPFEEPAIAVGTEAPSPPGTGALFEPSFAAEASLPVAASFPPSAEPDFPPAPDDEGAPPGWDAVAPPVAPVSATDAFEALTEPDGGEARLPPPALAPLAVEDAMPIEVPAATEAPDLSQMPSPFDEAEPASAEELFAEPPPPSWDEIVEACRRLASATGAMLVDPAGQVFAARGDWPDPGAEAIAAKLVATMARTLRDAPTRSISAPLGGLQLTAWRVPLAEGLVTAAFIADSPLRPDVRPAIDTEIHRGPGA